jgi:hypothetical protein
MQLSNVLCFTTTTTATTTVTATTATGGGGVVLSMLDQVVTFLKCSQVVSS